MHRFSGAAAIEPPSPVGRLLPPPAELESHREPSKEDNYPLTSDAVRAVEAIEFITDHLIGDEEYVMVYYTH